MGAFECLKPKPQDLNPQDYWRGSAPQKVHGPASRSSTVLVQLFVLTVMHQALKKSAHKAAFKLPENVMILPLCSTAEILQWLFSKNEGWVINHLPQMRVVELAFLHSKEIVSDYLPRSYRRVDQEK